MAHWQSDVEQLQAEKLSQKERELHQHTDGMARSAIFRPLNTHTNTHTQALRNTHTHTSKQANGDPSPLPPHHTPTCTSFDPAGLSASSYDAVDKDQHPQHLFLWAQRTGARSITVPSW